MANVVAVNKVRGEHFEAQFIARCGVDGLKAIKQPLSFKYIYGGKMQPIRTDVDFKVLRPDGRIAMVDNKSFDEDFFTFAQIDKNQLGRTLQYDHYNVPSGFVVYFRPSKQIVYFKGRTIFQKGPRTRFDFNDGTLLGGPYAFSPRLIFAAHNL